MSPVIFVENGHFARVCRSKGSSNDVARLLSLLLSRLCTDPSLLLLHRVYDLPSYLGRLMTRLCRSSLTLARLKTSLTLVFAIDNLMDGDRSSIDMASSEISVETFVTTTADLNLLDPHLPVRLQSPEEPWC